MEKTVLTVFSANLPSESSMFPCYMSAPCCSGEIRGWHCWVCQQLIFFNNRSTIFCDSPKLLTLRSAMKAGCRCDNTGITFPPLWGDYTNSLFCFLCCHFMNKNMVHHRCLKFTQNYILILLLLSVLLIHNVRSTLGFYRTNYWFADCPEDTEDLVQRSEFRN